MPSHKFRCNNCKNLVSVYFSISEFLKIKDNPEQCKECLSGLMLRDFLSIGSLSKIQRSSEDIIEDIRTEAREIADKIREGDSKLFENIYGEDINKLKQ